MRTYDEAFAAALDRRPFANGTEGYSWTANWCDRCLHDKGTRDGTNDRGCELLCVAIMGRTPVEWLEQDRARLGDQYHCTEFREDDDPYGDNEPDPTDPPPPSTAYDPEMPGQTTIFEALTDLAVQQFEQLPQREAVPA